MSRLTPLILSLVCLLSSASLKLHAGEETTYIATLSGVECNACKQTVAKALAKLDGVKTIRIVKKGENSHRLEVLTDGSHPIVKADADKALKKAEHYKILSWKKSS